MYYAMCVCVYVCLCICVCVIAVTRQDVEDSLVRSAGALERSTDGPERGGTREKQKEAENRRGKQ